MAIEISQIIGIAAGAFTASSMLPQVIKIVKKKEASQVSVTMMLILIVGVSLWVVYGIMKDDIPIIATNVFSFLVNCVLVFFKFRYRNNTSSSNS